MAPVDFYSGSDALAKGLLSTPDIYSAPIQDSAKKAADLVLNNFTQPNYIPTLYGQQSKESLLDTLLNAADVGSYLTPGIGDGRSVLDTITSFHDGNYGNAALNALGILPFLPSLGMVAKAKKASVLDDVLDMSKEARLARAADQGYTIEAYKGAMPYDWDSLPVTNFKGEIKEGADRIPRQITTFSYPDRPHSGFFSSDKDVANRFAAIYSDTNRGAVYPVKLKFDNPKIIDADGNYAASFQFESFARQKNTIKQYNEFKSALSDPKYDGVIVKNTLDEGDVYIPKAGNQVRSIFAAFDPTKKDSSDLLASLAPIGALGAYNFYNEDR